MPATNLEPNRFSDKVENLSKKDRQAYVCVLSSSSFVSNNKDLQVFIKYCDKYMKALYFPDYHRESSL